MKLTYLATLLLTQLYVLATSDDAAGSTSESQQASAELTAAAAPPSKDQFSLFDELARTVNKYSPTWRAQAKREFNWDADRIASLTNLRLSDEEFAAVTTLNLQDIVRASSDAPPANFSAAAKWPACAASILDIQDQSYCGSCWAVATATALTDRICIASGGKDQRKLSFQDLLECCKTCGAGCAGGSMVTAHKQWATVGLVTGGSYQTAGSCKPYQFAPCNDSTWKYLPQCYLRNSTLTCRTSCAANYGKDYATDLVKGKTFYRMTTEAAMIQDLVDNGPITIGMMVYSDFMTYKSGIYSFTRGTLLGGHAIKLIGYGVENGVKFWTCANSWGKAWGEKGTFRILRGVNLVQVENYAIAGQPL